MKRPLTFAILLTFILHPSSFVLAQGTLTPPGAPAPTMKTLDQVKPRTPISAPGTFLTAPGSYYLTTNLVTGSANADGITVRASNVTIDLNGFSIISTFGAGTDSPVGIRIDGSLSEVANVTVRNGQITGFDRAVRAAKKGSGE
jgi:hypothetical protein